MLSILFEGIVNTFFSNFGSITSSNVGDEHLFFIVLSCFSVVPSVLEEAAFVDVGGGGGIKPCPPCGLLATGRDTTMSVDSDGAGAFLFTTLVGCTATDFNGGGSIR